MTAHLISILSELLWPVCRREDALSISCDINCTLLKPIPKCPFLNVLNSWLVHALLDKAVN